MIFREIDENGDWVFGRGKQNYLTKQDAIGLNIKTRILSWVGDCFFDKNAGIDWVNRLGSFNQRGLLELDLKRIIAQSEDVTAIKEFDTLLTNRSFSASYSVNTVNSKEYKDSLVVEI